MRVHSVTTVITLAFGAASAIPPDNFGFPNSESSTPLSVVYQANGSALIVQPGQLFGIDGELLPMNTMYVANIS